jgi:NAD(P)-dependent dehydrogenase (short-subunit alcohol dehydrogenase family)
MSSSTKKVALVTGANKGIGFEISRQLGKDGVTVLMGARNVELGKAAAAKLQAEKLDVHFVHIDLEKADSIKAAAATIEREFKRLDILVNNAGIIVPGDGLPAQASVESVRRTFDTNVFGTIEVTQAMLPLIRKSPAGRIVNVSSGLASLSLNSDPAWEYAAIKYLGYGASKTALNMFTVQLAYELRETDIKVNSADPGYTATDLNGHRGPQTVEEGVIAAMRLALLGEDGPTGGFFDRNGQQPW